MSKLGKKMILVISGLVIAISVILVITSLVLTRNYSDGLMAMLTDIGVSVLKNDIQSQMDRIENFAIDWHNDETDFYAIATGDFKAVEETWLEDKQNVNDYCALIDKNGKVVWHTDNYNLAGVDLDVARALKGETIIGMAIDDNVPLSIQYIGPSGSGSNINGVVVIGLDLTLGTSLVDGVKTQTGSEVTLFGGKTRLVTTVTNSDGSRAVGTNMTDAVAQAVLDNSQTYIGQADILGQNHFVHYEPIECIHGDVIGAYFAGYSSAESDAMMAQVIFISLIIAAVATVGIALLMVLVIRTLVEKPLKEISVIADNMSSGHLSVPDSSFNFGNDEMGEFAHRLEETKHNLNSYISDMSGILAQMADGNFGATPQVAYAGDFVKIKESFEIITNTLSEVIRGINTAAEDVTAGAGQMADGTQMLADGTIKQASAIDELSSTVDNISEQVKRSAENSARANEMCQRSANKIEQQNEDISRMMSAMEDIKAKSKEISNIIQAIDDIAFQTNILALNAAVEAARAGEAGKGFAVVADEVRNLAAKSAEAASNTNSLISATISSVTDGAQIAEATAATMKEVIDISNSTNTLIAEISEAATQQAQSIQQVTQGLEDISTVVQQNSATAEESAASCEELSSQSIILRQQVSKLRV